MIDGIAHIGIAVEDLEATINFFEKNFNLKLVMKGEKGQTKWATISVGDVSIELIEASAPWLASFTGLHHIAFNVKGIEQVLQNLRSKGIKARSEPHPGFHGETIAFLDSENTEGITIELCEEET